ncbi:RagB/SusD family nutrient uptake outer membrane protein [Flavobacterium sp. GSB-24]|uniref:RagB/SusD family nutrient uptake outer membrane protein n=1 Tax=Flavobacterium sp. GSB-24 TaxID=2994319 RepID=UPI0024910656|nr:RagB/SusD family nutrient uptake outer membrane protein [Flavobacterium sp. GSB-24]
MRNYNFISYKNICLFSLQLMAALLSVSCNDLVEIDPPKTEVLDTDVFKTDANANSALVGMYSSMITDANILNVGFGASLSADETDPVNANDFMYLNFGTNDLTSTDFGAANYWERIYKIIYQTNSIIDNSTKSTGMSPAGKSSIIAEAKFTRALNYFYLVNMFGPVPLAVTSDAKVNMALPRASTAEVYAQIVSDLTDAETNLPSDYSSYGGKRDRPNKSAASALLAKVYLYTGDYVNAEKKATAVISNSGLYELLPKEQLNNVFLKDSRENIFGLNTETETGHFLSYEDYYYLYGSLYNSSGPVYVLTSSLANAFEAGDLRKAAWTGTFNFDGTDYYYSSKYKSIDGTGSALEYSIVLRLSEIYLIRAEAWAMQNNMANARNDLNAIRNRAGLADNESASQSGVLDAIIQEKRIELFLEYGNRWFDLKRTKRVDAVIGALKPTSWQSTDALYPIPLDQIKRAPQLTQNDGY